MASVQQPSLFGDDAASAPAKGSAKARASGSAPVAHGKSLRERVLDAIKVRPGSPEQIAHRINEPLMNVRPRCSELAARGLIVDSGGRASAMGGALATVWRVA